MKQQIIST